MPIDQENILKDARKVSIAVIKLKAKVGLDDDRYGGGVLINPGMFPRFFLGIKYMQSLVSGPCGLIGYLGQLW